MTNTPGELRGYLGLKKVRNSIPSSII